TRRDASSACRPPWLRRAPSIAESKRLPKLGLAIVSSVSCALMGWTSASLAAARPGSRDLGGHVQALRAANRPQWQSIVGHSRRSARTAIRSHESSSECWRQSPRPPALERGLAAGESFCATDTPDSCETGFLRLHR